MLRLALRPSCAPNTTRLWPSLLSLSWSAITFPSRPTETNMVGRFSSHSLLLAGQQRSSYVSHELPCAYYRSQNWNLVQTTGTINRAAKVITRCQKLASFTEDPGSTRRTFLSPPMRDCHEEITRWIEPLGVQVRIDAAGNLRAVCPAAQPNAPHLFIGSHLDTVPNAGAYDGILGVVLAVALLEELEGRRLPFAIEVVGFSEEEGVRFGVPFIGSRALVGRLDQQLLDIQDAQGISIRKAIEKFGLNPEEIPRAQLENNTLGYLEFHIEQGPVLEKLNLPLAAVEAIA